MSKLNKAVMALYKTRKDRSFSSDCKNAGYTRTSFAPYFYKVKPVVADSLILCLFKIIGDTTPEERMSIVRAVLSESDIKVSPHPEMPDNIVNMMMS